MEEPLSLITSESLFISLITRETLLIIEHISYFEWIIPFEVTDMLNDKVNDRNNVSGIGKHTQRIKMSWRSFLKILKRKI